MLHHLAAMLHHLAAMLHHPAAMLHHPAVDNGPFGTEIVISAQAAVSGIGDNFSISYALAGSVSFNNKAVGGINWALVGEWKETWNSTGSHSQTGSVGVSITNVDSGSKIVDFLATGYNVRAVYSTTDGQAAAESISIQMGWRIQW
jgi:hypothetical protein